VRITVGAIMSSRLRALRAVMAVGVAGAAGMASAGTLAACSGGSSPSSATRTAAGQARVSGPANALQQQYQDVVKAVLPSVVEINTNDATGSGVVYDHEGDIVTNAHVVGNATTVQVQWSTTGTNDESASIPTLQAKVIGTFTPDDLAVVRVTSHAGSLHPATFGSSGGAETGQLVLAMGSPLGLSGTVTQGIISATGRTVTESSTAGGAPTTIVGALQISAAINGGNSGGALADLASQVIGIPTAAAQNPSSGSQATGIGFAIPSDTVTSIAGQLISTGKVSSSNRAALGISAHNAVPDGGQPTGVTVASVTSGGPADKAGIRKGDVIIAVNNDQIPNVAALTAELAPLKPGDKVTVQYSRNGTVATTTVTLGELKS
jgi:putative serine protease PepD